MKFSSVKYTDNPVQYVSGENQTLFLAHAGIVRGSQTLLLAHGSVDTSPEQSTMAGKPLLTRLLASTRAS